MKQLRTTNRRIAFSSLPKNFCHAIEVARRLNVRYLWINALCIIQDSPVDWQTESALMHLIYSQTVLDISTDLNRDSVGGCFNRQSKSVIDQFVVNVVIESSLSGREWSRLGLFLQRDAWLREQVLKLPDINNAPAASRGWICQERLLSPQVLHYTSAQLYFECRFHLIAEEGLPVDLLTRLGTLRLLQTKKASASPVNILTLWYEDVIQDDYSPHKLTLPSDKLPAVSHIAQIFRQDISSSYIAGVGGLKLQMGLAWMRAGPSSKPREYRCPSLSWASIDGPV
jgi:hypothetical protein